MYITILICIAIIIVSFLSFALFMRRRIAIKYITASFIITLAVEMILFMIWPVPSFYYDEIRLKVGGGTEQQNIFIKTVLVQNVSVDFPEVVDGEWLWLNGMYGWQADKDITDSIVLKVPAGITRKIVFQGQNSAGVVNVIDDDFIERVDLYSENNKDIVVEIPNSTSELLLKNEAIRIFVFLIINLSILLMVFILIKLFLSRFIEIINKYKYEFALFFASLFIIIRDGVYPNLYNWQGSFYFKGYEFGFVKRGLIGEIFININPYTSKDFFVLFKLTFLILFFLLLSLVLGKLIKERVNDEGFRWFLLLFILSMPSTFIFIPDDLRLDIYVFIIFALTCFFISVNHLIWCVPILIFNMLLINETSCTFFLLPILFMLLYKCIKYNDNIYAVIIILSVLISVVLCAVFLLRPDPWLKYDISQIVTHLQQHSGFDLNMASLHSEAANLNEQIQVLATGIPIDYKKYLIFLLMMLPAMILFGKLFYIIYNCLREEHSLIQNISYWLLILSPLSAFLPMCIAIDYPRYFSFMFNALFAILFFIIYEEKIQLTYFDLCNSVNLRLKKLNVWPISICVFYLYFGKFTATVGVETVSKFVNFLSALLGI